MLRRLIDQELAGAYNATIAKLILTANHGLIETSKNISQSAPMMSEEEKARMFSLIGKVYSEVP